MYTPRKAYRMMANVNGISMFVNLSICHAVNTSCRHSPLSYVLETTIRPIYLLNTLRNA